MCLIKTVQGIQENIFLVLINHELLGGGTRSYAYKALRLLKLQFFLM